MKSEYRNIMAKWLTQSFMVAKYYFQCQKQVKNAEYTMRSLTRLIASEKRLKEGGAARSGEVQHACAYARRASLRI